MVIEIKNKSQLSELVEKSISENVVQSKLNEREVLSIVKYYEKLFSLAARNYCSVSLDTEKNVLTIYKTGKMGYTKSCNYSMPIHMSNSKFLPDCAHPGRIEFNRISSPDFEINFWHNRFTPVFIDSQGRPHVHNNVNIERSGNFVNEIDTWLNNQEFKIVSIVNMRDYIDLFFNNPMNVRQLSYEEAYSYGFYLVLTDDLYLKRGMIVQRSDYGRYGNGSGWHNYSPKSAIERDGVYMINFSIACNLNMTSIHELNELKRIKHECYKQSHGCQRGCRTSCTAESANKVNQKRIQTYINLYNEIFNSK